MQQSAPTCPECLSPSAQWLPTTSEISFVDYFRCERCGTVWVLGDSPENTKQLTPFGRRSTSSVRMFLFLDIEAGLLFADMAHATDDCRRRQLLRNKSQGALENVQRFIQRMSLSDMELEKVRTGLDALQHAIERIPA